MKGGEGAYTQLKWGACACTLRGAGERGRMGREGGRVGGWVEGKNGGWKGGRKGDMEGREREGKVDRGRRWENGGMKEEMDGRTRGESGR